MSGNGRRLEFVELLGQGGFGSVYLVDLQRDNNFSQRLALKVLSAEKNAVEDIAARQRDEARLLGQLNHDHIVKVFDLIEMDGRPAVLMEYIEGADAQQLLRSGPLPPKAATRLVCAAAAALETAGNAISPRTGRPLGVIHRDIKPANLLVSRHGGVKVLDFGIARADFDREGHTSSVMYGTARYIPPEQWLNSEMSPAVDIYALGVTFLELLTRHNSTRPPLMPEAYQTHVEEVLAKLAPSPWHQQARQLIRRMLAYAPADRPTARQVHDQLLLLLESAPGEGLGRLAQRTVPPLIAARRSQFANADLPAALTLSTDHPLPTPPPPPPSRRNTIPPALIAGLVGFSVVIGLGIVALWQATPLSPSPSPATTLTKAVTDHTQGKNTDEDTAPSDTVPSDTASSDVASLEDVAVPSEDAAPVTEPAPVSRPPPDASPPVPDAAPTRAVTLIGPSLDAQFEIDGQAVEGEGRITLTLPYGSHQVRVIAGGSEVGRTLVVGASTPTRYRWSRGSDRLVAVDDGQ